MYEGASTKHTQRESIPCRIIHKHKCQALISCFLGLCNKFRHSLISFLGENMLFLINMSFFKLPIHCFPLSQSARLATYNHMVLWFHSILFCPPSFPLPPPPLPLHNPLGCLHIVIFYHTLYRPKVHLRNKERIPDFLVSELNPLVVFWLSSFITLLAKLSKIDVFILMFLVY